MVSQVVVGALVVAAAVVKNIFEGLQQHQSVIQLVQSSSHNTNNTHLWTMEHKIFFPRLYYLVKAFLSEH